MNATTVALKDSYEIAIKDLNLFDILVLAILSEETTRVIIF